MHSQNTQIRRVQDQQPLGRSSLASATTAATAFSPSSPAPWIPTPYHLLPAPQGWGGSVQESRTFSLFLPAPPRPFWESPGTGLPTSWQPIKWRVSFGLLRKDSQCRATPIPGSRMMTLRAELPPSSGRTSQWGRAGKGRVGKQPGVRQTTSSFHPPWYLYPQFLFHCRHHHHRT